MTRLRRKMTTTGVNPLIGYVVPKINEALVYLNEVGHSGDGPTYSWANEGFGGASYDLDTVEGTGIIRTHPDGTILMDGAAGTYLSTPDSAANSFTEYMDIRAPLRLGGTLFAVINTIASKWELTPFGKSYNFRVLATSGFPSLTISTDGTDTGIFEYVGNVAVPADATGVRALFEGDNGAGNSRVQFYYQTTVLPWATLGAEQQAAVGNIFDSDSQLLIGGLISGVLYNFDGYIGHIEMYDNTEFPGNPLQVSCNPSDHTAGSTFTSAATSEVWTMVGGTEIQNTGRTLLHNPGATGLRPAAPTTIVPPMVIFVVARITDTPALDSMLFGSRTDNTKFASVFADDSATDKFAISQDLGTAVALAEAFDNDLHCFTAEFNNDGTTKLTVSGVGTVTGDVGNDVFEYITLMAGPDGLNGMVGDVSDFVLFNETLTAGEISSVETSLGF